MQNQSSENACSLVLELIGSPVPVAQARAVREVPEILVCSAGLLRTTYPPAPDAWSKTGESDIAARGDTTKPVPQCQHTGSARCTQTISACTKFHGYQHGPHT